MIKLTQRAWNNVIIFSMLILIVLFNFSSQFLNDENEEALSSLVPDDMTITTMEFEQHKVERIGQGWRDTSGKCNHSELVELVEHWKAAKIELVTQNDSEQRQLETVKLWFAGQGAPVVYQFVQVLDKTFIAIDNKTYQLLYPTFPMLILSE